MLALLAQGACANVDLNGWIMPTESGEHNKYVAFGDYYSPTGVYSLHLGQDFEGDTGDPVYALADGEVIESNNAVGGYGPGGTSGGALIALFTTSDGSQFKALYGHIDNPHPKGAISAGDVLGYINNYDPPHLHFGIHSGKDYPIDGKKWRGYITDVEYQALGHTYGWIDPIQFLEDYSPANDGLDVPEQMSTSANGETLGIDVSDHQGSIDWYHVAGAGYSFAFVKATEGEGWTGDAAARQQNFETNMQGASSVGMLVGAYHFARPDLGNSAADEARWFVDVAGDHIKPGYLRPVLDIEVGADTLGNVALSRWVSEWIETVISETGVEPLIYTSADYAGNYLDASLTRYDLWVAQWTYDTTTSPNTGIWDECVFWQYSDEGSVPGISGNVDLDIFSGWTSELSDFAIATASTNAQITLTLYVHEGSAYGLLEAVSRTILACN